MNFRTIFLLSFSAIVNVTCQTEPETADASASVQTQWYKGNTHAHTVICGHADTSPAEVTKWYHDRGYHFLILSEHNHFIDPDTVPMPSGKRPDFILIPGEEVTGHKDIHTTAMNIEGLVDWGDNLDTKTAIIQQHVDSTRARNGIPILNHPNFQSGAQAADILEVDRLHFFELFNGHPAVFNWGRNDEDFRHAPTEVKWDSLLSAGMRLFGVSSDDAHVFQEYSLEYSNPGRGWVMVRSHELSPGAITEAMSRGDFYATNGVILQGLEASPQGYRLAVDTAATSRELRSAHVVGRPDGLALPGYVIEFIGSGGRILKRVEGLSADYIPRGSDGYVRARVSYRPAREAPPETFYAWTQPLFLD